jgi:CRISPR-associated endonuclease/helicase Cas3
VTLARPSSRPPDGLVAHTPNEEGKWHLLEDHLRDVADLAEGFGRKWMAGEICTLLGLTHDLGKAAPAFQTYLLAANEGRKAPGSPHSDPGAAAAKQFLGPFLTCVQGHHSGIPDQGTAKSRLAGADRDATLAATRLLDGMELRVPQEWRQCSKDEMDPLIRMCFSALVDADRLNTEEHFDPSVSRGGYPEINEYARALRNCLSSFPEPTSPIDQLRVRVQKCCRDSASRRPGFFRLTVPTGGGKTLASMLFALEHCVQHGQERVVVAIPYTSIIDQTAATYRGVFGDRPILEHHSARPFDPGTEELQESLEAQDKEALRLRLSAENWDCPIVVTTNVQLFESLLSNLPSRTRKLHNLARSVIILDEIQTLPTDLLEPCLSAIGWLVEFAGATVIFCTATQPDFEAIPGLPSQLKTATEIVENPESLFKELKRVEFHYDGTLSCENLADKLRSYQQVLCILNTRKDSVEVFDALDDPDAFYLSTLLVPAHRKQVLAEIKSRLQSGLDCRIISTQVVECGVDISLPVVFRAMAPLPSIVQAAGRCNRHGELFPSLGSCHVFDLEGGSVPTGSYASATATTATRYVPARLSELEMPTVHSQFFRDFLGNTKTDRSCPTGEGKAMLQALRLDLDFPTVAANSNLISEGTLAVVVRDFAPDEIHRLTAQLNAGRSPRYISRQLGQFSVSLFEPHVKAMQRDGIISTHDKGLYFWNGKYNLKIGVGLGTQMDPVDLIIS